MKQLLKKKNNDIIQQIIERLGEASSDWPEQYTFIKHNRNHGSEQWLSAGVLLPLIYKKSSGFSLQLIKRSSLVSQAGDISAPGGMLEDFKDHLLSLFIAGNATPVLRGKAREFARKRGKRNFQIISLFFSNALRESWEEIGLNPFNIAFLGPLPTYTLKFFTKTIFPSVGLVKKPWIFRPNKEVEKVVQIPLASFFDPYNYGMFQIHIDKNSRTDSHDLLVPCFIHKDCDDQEEILWGATLTIVMSFLKLVFDFESPDIQPKRIVSKTLPANYMTGRNTVHT